MKVTLTSEHHFFHGPDGGVYTDTSYPYSFWQRFLNVFAEVEVVARVGQRTNIGNAVRADGPAVRFFCLPDYLGSEGLIRSWPALNPRIRAAARSCNACILRVPSAVGTLLWRELKREQKPYGAQVVGDPMESLAGLGFLPRRVIRPLSARQLRAQVRDAAATTFVTKTVLQQRYPPPPCRFTTHVSDVELPDAVFGQPARSLSSQDTPKLAFVGSLAQRYKGLDVLLHAFASCRQRGVKARLDIVGDGRFRSEYQEIARNLAVENEVAFRGAIRSGGPIFDFLRSADLLIHPARTEGLPRVLLEAMAVGLPCIATRVGGIPELLDGRHLVASNDSSALADKIVEVLSDRGRLVAMSMTNRRTAWDYRAGAQSARLNAFYNAVLAAKG